MDPHITIIDDGHHSEEHATTALRWVGKKGTTTEPRRLEQKYIVTMFEHGLPKTRYEEWRSIQLHLED